MEKGEASWKLPPTSKVLRHFREIFPQRKKIRLRYAWKFKFWPSARILFALSCKKWTKHCMSANKLWEKFLVISFKYHISVIETFPYFGSLVRRILFPFISLWKPITDEGNFLSKWLCSMTRIGGSKIQSSGGIFFVSYHTIWCSHSRMLYNKKIYILKLIRLNTKS